MAQEIPNKKVVAPRKSKKARFSPGRLSAPATPNKKGRRSPEKQRRRAAQNKVVTSQKKQESKIFPGRLSAAFQR